MYYEEDYYSERECYSCEQKAIALDKASDLFDELVKRLYITDQFDLDQIERTVFDMCAVLRVKEPTGEINIERKPLEWLDQWVVENDYYLKNLTKTA